MRRVFTVTPPLLLLMSFVSLPINFFVFVRMTTRSVYPGGFPTTIIVVNIHIHIIIIIIIIMRSVYPGGPPTPAAAVTE